MSAKVYVVMEQELTMSGVRIIAAFRNEGEAEQSANAHKELNKRTWVEETNYYE